MYLLNEAQSVQFFKHVNASPFLRVVALISSTYLIWFMVVFLLWITKSLYWIPAILLPWGVTLLLSTWIKRLRPYQKHGFVPIMKPGIETSSFPSEHATLAFAIAAVFVMSGSVFYVVLFCAFLVALSRVATGVHYFSDVLVGALIGFLLSTASQIVIVLLALS